MTGITGIIHTKNEQRFIGQAIRSLEAFTDEIIVADMASTDDTRAIAESMGARVIDVPDFGYLEPALKFSHAEAQHPWVIRLDADELVQPSLAHRLRELVDADTCDVVSIPRVNYFFGSPLTVAGWSPDRQPRLYRSTVRVPDGVPIHGQFLDLTDARIVELEASDEMSLVHFNYLDWHGFVEKVNRYTDVEATELVASGAASGFGRALRSAVREVLARGVRRRGFGESRGSTLVMLMVAYRLLVHAKARQLRQVGNADEVATQYLALGDRLLAGEGQATL